MKRYSIQPFADCMTHTQMSTTNWQYNNNKIEVISVRKLITYTRLDDHIYSLLLSNFNKFIKQLMIKIYSIVFINFIIKIKKDSIVYCYINPAWFTVFNFIYNIHCILLFILFLTFLLLSNKNKFLLSNSTLLIQLSNSTLISMQINAYFNFLFAY